MRTEAELLDFTRAREMYPSEIRQLIHSQVEMNRYDRRHDTWYESFSTSREYSRSLGTLISDVDQRQVIYYNPVAWLIRERQDQGELQMLDLMSYGAVHRELEVNGCAVALSDKRKDPDIEKDSAA